MTDWDDRHYGDEYGPANCLNSNGRSAYRRHDPYAAYNATVPCQAVPRLGMSHLVASIPVGYESGYPVSYGVSSFGELSVSPKVAPLAAQMAVHPDFDPSLANGSVTHRGSTLLVDPVICIALITAPAVLGGIVGSSGSGVMVLLLSLFLGPDGFYLYRVAGGSIFDGSPGKHATGMKIGDTHGISVSARDSFMRNAWILPSIIPVAGWFASAGLAGWIVMDTSRDPLGRGHHELSIRTQMVEKPETREL